jgi:hypothetical protein
MSDPQVELAKIELETRRLAIEESLRPTQLQQEAEKRKADERHHRDEVLVKLAELRSASGRGLRFTTSQATVAAAALAVVSGVGGACIQSLTTREVEAGKSTAALSIERTKVEGELQLERQKQGAAGDLAGREFETKLIFKAIDTPDRKEAVRNLQFFRRAGFIQDKDEKIAGLSESEYPSITGNDPAKGSLSQYFEALQNRRFADAYALVAEARKAERAIQFGPNHFANFESSFANTTGYDNVAVTFETASGGVRKYTVSYDVVDTVPHNELSEFREQPFSSYKAMELFKRDAIVNVFVANLKEYYIVPDAAIDTIKSYIGSRTVNELFDPTFIATAVRELTDTLDLKSTSTPPKNARVNRHFLHDIIMVQEKDGSWKIRSGLNTPTITLNYK